MATQMFEGRGHAAIYQKYRFAPGKELQQTILSYLQEKRVSPAELVVDVGCGSGQGTRFLAEHFKKVVGTDISEAQIQEARDAPSPPNVSYLVCPAEELPLEDASVDLLASFTAAHWFDTEKFMREANRVVKPGGCVAISTYTLDMSVRYGNCSEKLTEVFRESWDQLLKYSHERVKHVLENYREIFEALPFPDKKRITDIFDKIPMTVAGVVGYLESVSPYQAFMKNDPEAAKSLLQETEKRMLDTMGVSSRETPVEFWDFTRTQDFLLQGNSGHSSSLGCVNLRKDLHRRQLHHIPGWGLGPSGAGAMAAAGPRHPADPAGHSAVSPAGADLGGLSAVMAGAGTSAVWRSRAECSQASLARLGTRLWRSVALPCQTLAG